MKPDLYRFIREAIGPVFLNNVSGKLNLIQDWCTCDDSLATGGTDLCGGIVGACPTLPIYEGAIQVPILSIKVEAYDDHGKAVPVGYEGDLVIARPIPNMPLGLLGDDEQKTRYRDTYFNHYNDKTVWWHADYSKPNSLCTVSPF